MTDKHFAYAPLADLDKWEALGWVATDSLDGTHHGDYASLVRWHGEGLPRKPGAETRESCIAAAQIARTAADLTGGDREQSYGDKLINHRCIALLWDGYLAAKQLVDGPDATTGPEDVANMMELLKVARRLGPMFKLDNYTDGAGYAACAGEIRQREENNE